MAVTVGMVSLGCPKNQVDGEMLLAQLKNAGYVFTDDPAQAQVILVNTCGFIESAKQEAIETILEMARYKTEGCLQALVVTGCLAERYRRQVAEQMPEVDAVVSIGCNGDIVSVVEEALAGRKKVYEAPKENLPLEGERLLFSPPYTAYLKIAEGCNNRCAYCAIPGIRGPMRSRKVESVTAEARLLARQGVKELIVVAQDPTRYGEDLYGECRLPELLTRLCEIDGITWIRLMYAYPERVTPELLAVMAREEKIVNYIDLPLQHCNGRVLRSMRRPGDRESLTRCINTIRQTVPGVVVRTTVMVGFPGETEEEFEELCEFVKDMKFPRLGCFVFSPEEDTPAAEMPGQIDPETACRRQRILMELQEHIMEQAAAARIGQRLTVLIEGYDDAHEAFYGRSFADAPEIDGLVYVTAPSAEIGSFVTVQVKGTENLDLLATIV